MNEKKKIELIEDLNRNYITFLSYGKEDFVPAGRFFVKDIELDELDEDFDVFNKKNNARIVLVKEDDEKFELTIPLKIFINDFSKIAYENAQVFGTGVDFYKDPQKIANKETDYITTVDIEDVALLKKAKGLYLEDYEEIDAKSSIGLDLSNYSICPVDLGMWRELIRERDYTEKVERAKPKEVGYGYER